MSQSLRASSARKAQPAGSLSLPGMACSLSMLSISRRARSKAKRNSPPKRVSKLHRCRFNLRPLAAGVRLARRSSRSLLVRRHSLGSPACLTVRAMVEMPAGMPSVARCSWISLAERFYFFFATRQCAQCTARPCFFSLGFGSRPDFAEEVDGGVAAKLGGEVVEASLEIVKSFGGFFGRGEAVFITSHGWVIAPPYPDTTSEQARPRTAAASLEDAAQSRAFIDDIAVNTAQRYAIGRGVTAAVV